MYLPNECWGLQAEEDQWQKELYEMPRGKESNLNVYKLI